MKSNYTHLVLVVDRSGSMASIKVDAQGGINTLLEDQKKIDTPCTVSLYQFDDRYERVFGPVSINQAPQYTLTPRGSTALLDAVNRAIVETGSFLRDLDESERPSQVKFIVVTDGQENASREATAQMVRDAIKHQEQKYSWEFVYIGSDLNGVADAHRFGFSNRTQYTASAQSTNSMYRGLSSAIMDSRVNNVPVASNLAASYSDVTTPVTPAVTVDVVSQEN